MATPPAHDRARRSSRARFHTHKVGPTSYRTMRVLMSPGSRAHSSGGVPGWSVIHARLIHCEIFSGSARIPGEVITASLLRVVIAKAASARPRPRHFDADGRFQ